MERNKGAARHSMTTALAEKSRDELSAAQRTETRIASDKLKRFEKQVLMNERRIQHRIQCHKCYAGNVTLHRLKGPEYDHKKVYACGAHV